LALADGEIGSVLPPLAGYHYGYRSLDLAAYEAASAALKQVMGSLNSALANRTFLLGDRVTVADICVAMALCPLFAKVLDATYLASFLHVTRWFTTCVNQPNFKAIMGTFEFCKQVEAVGSKSTAPAAISGGVFGKIHKMKGELKIDRIAQSLIAAKFNGLKIDLVDSDTKSPEFLSKFPMGKVPGFEGVDGVTIAESASISRYIAASVADTNLLGSSKKESALVESYLATSEEFFGAQRPLLYPFWGYLSKENADDQANARANVIRHLAYLNTQLATRTFLVGERVTLADIAMVCSLLNIFKHVIDPKTALEYKNVLRWFNTCLHQPSFKSVVQAPSYSKPVFSPVAAKKVEKTEKPVKEKKAEKPAKEKKPEPAEDLEAIAAAEQKSKEKNPLDLLPKSSLILDEWKRFYSNNDTRPTAVDWFWKNFDPQGYSIWKCDYKYNDELTQIFMSSNLIGGFFQRLESARKYAFGSMLVLGDAKKSKITGYFVFRGLDVPFEVKDSADYESYKFTKVDHTKPAVRESINAVFAWDEKIDGMPCADGKTFK